MSEDKKLAELSEGEVIGGRVVKIYASTRNVDRAEGRGSMIDHSYHTKHRSAVIGCKGIDFTGSDGKVDERLAIRLSDGRHFLLQNNNHPIVVVSEEDEVNAAAELRESALKKLSYAERAALEV